MNQLHSIVTLLNELGQLRRIKHEGWRLAGIDNPESVAEHSLRAAQIAYFLAKIANYENPYEVVCMVVFHDMGECRIGDLHKIAQRYVKADEKGAVVDQCANLPDSMKEELVRNWLDVEENRTEAGILAKDADLLEQAFMAKQYQERGISAVENWLDNIGKNLRTEAAKSILLQLKQLNTTDWWKNLKKL